MHLDDVLRTIARNEEENEILRQTAAHLLGDGGY